MPARIPPRSELTLRQCIALAGFARQDDVLRAVAAAGMSCPQAVLSAMVAGDPKYPKARRAVAHVLDMTEDELLHAIKNSARAKA